MGQGNYRFQRYDYGELGNIERYGTGQPPEFDLGNVKVRVILIAGTKDILSTREDVLGLQGKLGNSRLHWLEGWGHITPLFARDPTPLWKILDSELTEFNCQ